MLSTWIDGCVIEGMVFLLIQFPKHRSEIPINRSFLDLALLGLTYPSLVQIELLPQIGLENELAFT
jgi:hypothetical protein